MGGYGALKLGAHPPRAVRRGRHASPASPIQATARRDLPRPEIIDRVFGDEITPADDVLALLEAADPTSLPTLYVGCGTEDGAA